MWKGGIVVKEADKGKKVDEMDDEHIVQKCICLKCYYRWIDVRPVGVSLKDLECPSCHLVWYVIGTGEPID